MNQYNFGERLLVRIKNYFLIKPLQVSRVIITSQLELIIMVTKDFLNVASSGLIVKALLLVNYQQQETILKLYLSNFKSCFKDIIL